ncbi:major facilitator superfamily domain-containing protein [Suillus subalutaceus]|uniref:major facilitator superfamily domain-containing protein n=1 Tax=Suillus subalutaceus TaxID=48586 RepID=UPI001B85C690|nr:major facilitator superfamily domain-containing protein [Suillus subalutaceus]KAG1838706.1 major facilitator superfamily domain-containing protein [Suillus subluteus]KAG1839168.1 major facilitator superfamily domain-containing protein [Suillus subluteus]KAG1848694.1 major facilitator superfamily domain-containing protein [Suillus subluteus]KAG1854955.1 major facilitator superfamily domain-containing protein [Suillus subalutaceus]
MEPQPPALLSAPRMLTLLGSILVSLSSGTNYIYSAYAPQLGARLLLSHTRLNVIGLAGNVGVYLSGPAWGRVVDSKGPRIPLISAFACLVIGYLGIKHIYDDGAGTAISFMHLVILIACSFMTGLAGNAGLAAAMNTTAKSFPETSRGTITGLVLSGFGLSAFFFATVASLAFPGDTSALLLVLGLGAAMPMLLGLVIVRQIPLPPPSTTIGIEGGLRGREEYQPIPSGDAALFIRGNDSHTSLLDPTEQVHETSNYHVPEPSITVELVPDRIVSRGSSVRRSTSRAKPVHDGPNVYGKQLWLTPDFYLVFLIMSLLSGTGIMYINNVGSISQALYAKGNPDYDELEALRWQAAQVSTLSVCNFAGRILIGLIADLIRFRLCLPRAYCFCIVSTLFVVSQLSAISINDVAHLWKATALLGLAYGSLFGIAPTIVIDWFGLSHLSENWGFISLSPLVGGNLFSLMFGRNLDSHASNDDTETHSPLSLIRRGGLPSEHQCFDGRDCYVSSLYVTATACLIALGLSVWAGIRDQRKTVEAKREVIWDAEE